MKVPKICGFMIIGGCFLFAILSFPWSSFGVVLFQEPFENIDYSTRGWYDSTGGTLSTAEHVTGSSRSLECRFLAGGSTCSGGTPSRHLFTETDSVYVSYYVKYSSNWTGSNLTYWPHEFYILTNKDGKWTGPAYTYLTAYIEQNKGVPLLIIQDGKNIDETRVGQDLTEVTETRAVAGCNGDSDGYGNGSCYSVGSIHYNGKIWRAGATYFKNETGLYYKNDWHHIEAYFRLNSISGGKGLRDGILRYWYDGKLIIEYTNVVLRTGQYSDIKFNQFIIAPYIGSSPVDQTFWIDNLTVATERPTPPNPPAEFRLVE